MNTLLKPTEGMNRVGFGQREGTRNSINLTIKTMKTNQIKTIDLQVTEWFDKTYGNSYFSAIITINFGMANQKRLFMPFQYGYGNHAEYEAFKLIKKELKCFTKFPDISYWQAYRESKIIYRYSKRETLKKNMYSINDI